MLHQSLNFYNKTIYTFTKRNLESLLESTIEYSKNTIIDFLDNFDREANQVIKKFDLTEEEVKNIFEKKTYSGVTKLLKF